MSTEPSFFARPSAIDTARAASANGDRKSSGKAPDSLHCILCQKKLTADEKAINLKLISRTVTTFYCMDCLGKKLGCGREQIEERIRYYRESGECTLFR